MGIMKETGERETEKERHIQKTGRVFIDLL